MPTYIINGQKVKADKPLTEDEIDEIGQSLAPPPPPQTGGLEGVTRAAGIFNRAVAPYATAAATGAAAGLPIAGVGAIPGAAAGVTALGLTDIATGLYNLGAYAMGGRPVITGSEAIRSLYPERTFRTPETPVERIASAGIEGATAAGATAKALNVAANMLRPNTATQNVLSALSQQPVAQRAAGATAAAVPQAMVEASEEDGLLRDPMLLTASGLLSGLVAGRATIRGGEAVRGAPSTQQLYQQARATYKRVDQSGVNIAAPAYDQLLNNLLQRLQLEGFTDQAAIRSQLNKMEMFRGKDRSISSLDTTRSDISKTLLKSSDENVRRLGRVMADEIDDFINAATPAEVTGNAAMLPQVQQDLLRARELWSKVSRSEQIEELVRRAKLSDQPFDTALRSEFRTLAKNERRFNRFSPEERQFILRVVEGGPVARALTELSEALRLRSLGGFMYVGAGGATLPVAQQAGLGADPATAAAMVGGIAATRAGAQAMGNRLAQFRAAQAARAMRGFTPAPIDPIRLPALQNALRAPYTNDPERERAYQLGF